MKKLFLVAVATVGFAVSGTAQEFKFGVKAGLNNTNFTGDADTDAKTSFYFGGFADYAVSEKFHIQPEVLYSSEGASDDWGISYLRIPIMAKYYVAESFSILAGPSIAFKVATEEDAVDELTKSMDFGLGVGAAYDLENGLFFDARYNFGLQNISDVDGVDIKNSGFQVGLGYKF